MYWIIVICQFCKQSKLKNMIENATFSPKKNFSAGKSDGIGYVQYQARSMEFQCNLKTGKNMI